MVTKKMRFQIYRRYDWHPYDQDECEGENNQFDAFIFYNNHDDEWSRQLLRDLEQMGYKLCCHEQDFEGGMPINANIEQVNIYIALHNFGHSGIITVQGIIEGVKSQW